MVTGCVVRDVLELIAELWDEEEVEEDGLDPKMVEEGRKDEVDFMVHKLHMFEFGTW